MLSASDCASDCRRIQKIANLLASDFDGERANAGALLARMAAERKLTVSEFLALARTPESPPSRPEPEARWWEGGDLLDHLAQASRYAAVLTSWEVNFACDVSRRYHAPEQLTEKQHATVLKIIAKGRRAALAGVQPDWGEVDV